MNTAWGQTLGRFEIESNMNQCGGGNVQWGDNDTAFGEETKLSEQTSRTPEKRGTNPRKEVHLKTHYPQKTVETTMKMQTASEDAQTVETREYKRSSNAGDGKSQVRVPQGRLICFC
jgi:hypothetical protein